MGSSRDLLMMHGPTCESGSFLGDDLQPSAAALGSRVNPSERPDRAAVFHSSALHGDDTRLLMDGLGWDG